MQSVIRVGEVSKVNYDKGTIEVAYKDRDDSVTDEICMVSNNLYRMPVVGQMACVLHNSADQEMGTCIGTFWNDDNKPRRKGGPVSLRLQRQAGRGLRKL